MKRAGQRSRKLYKGYKKKWQQILKRSGGKCEAITFVERRNWTGTETHTYVLERCGRHGAMVDHITPRNMAGSKSKWLNDERNLIMLCIDHSEFGVERLYRAEKYESLQAFYPHLDWEGEGPWREFR